MTRGLGLAVVLCGSAILPTFLSAQNDYRSIQLTYLNLVGSYLTAASQLNLAVGLEVLQ